MITRQKRRQYRVDATMQETQQITAALHQWFRSQDIKLDVAALAMVRMLAAYALVKNAKHPKDHVKKISKLMNMFAQRMKHR